MFLFKYQLTLFQYALMDSDRSIYKMVTKEKKDLNPFHKTVVIDAPPSEVWQAIIIPALMKKWMMEEEINIRTDWQVGSEVSIEGNQHWVYFKNKGVVIQFEKEEVLSYSHLSSLSKLKDVPESYSVLNFSLEPKGKQTVLTFSISNFPTEVI